MDVNDQKIIVDICQSLLSGKIDFIGGCRQLASMSNQLGLGSDPDLLPFVGVASETDDYLESNIRGNFNADYLKRLDEDISDYVALARPSITSACKVLTSKYNVS